LKKGLICITLKVYIIQINSGWKNYSEWTAKQNKAVSIYLDISKSEIG